MNATLVKIEDPTVEKDASEPPLEQSTALMPVDLSAEAAFAEEMDRRLYTRGMSSFFFTFMQAKNATVPDQL